MENTIELDMNDHFNLWTLFTPEKTSRKSYCSLDEAQKVYRYYKEKGVWNEQLEKLQKELLEKGP